jgi:hypothetical protein
MQTIRHGNRNWTVTKRETTEEVAARLPQLGQMMREYGRVAMLEMTAPRNRAALGFEYANGRIQVIPV